VSPDVRAEPAPRLVQAGLGRARGPGDLPGGQAGVVVQLDGAPLAVRQVADRGTQGLDTIQVIRGRQPVRRDRSGIPWLPALDDRNDTVEGVQAN